MITDDELIILDEVEKALGKKIIRKENGYHSCFCPYCNHHKPKLWINLKTQRFKCWVCKNSGKLYRFFNFLNINLSYSYLNKNINKLFSQENPIEKNIILPLEFISLDKKNRDEPDYNLAYNYLINRGLSYNDIIRYNLGYCYEGIYKNFIIIPSYNNLNKLNFFMARSFNNNSYIRHIKPNYSEDIIFNELFINFNEDVILVEGFFDAISTKNNCIPLLGKSFNNQLLNKLLESNLKNIYVALDKDAINDSLDMCKKLHETGKNVYLIPIEDDKDPNELGFDKFLKLKETNSILYNFENLIKFKINIAG